MDWNINSILQKLDRLKSLAEKTKAPIKVDNSISNSEIKISSYCILRCDRNRNGEEEFPVMLDRICVLIWELPLWEILKAYFLIFFILLPKAKPIFVGIYRFSNSISFLECFNKHLDDINLGNEIFLLGDFNIKLFRNGKYILKEN